MANLFKRIPHITLNLKDGTPIDLDGDNAQRVLQDYTTWQQGGIAQALTYVDGSGNTQKVNFDCLCGITIKPQTKEPVAGRPCEDITCFE